MSKVTRTEPIVPIPEGVVLPHSCGQAANVHPIEEITYPDTADREESR